MVPPAQDIAGSKTAHDAASGQSEQIIRGEEKARFATKDSHDSHVDLLGATERIDKPLNLKAA